MAAARFAAAVALKGQNLGLETEVAAILWPAGHYLPLGVAAEPATMVRFRAEAPVGTKINLVMRLAAYGRDFCIRICSGSGAKTEVSLPGGSEKVAVLPCAVEPGGLVTANLSSLDDTLDRNETSDAINWILQGILYFDPTSVESSRAPVKRILHAASIGEDRRAPSLDAFEKSTNSYWLSCSTTERTAPIFADDADRLAFLSGAGNSDVAPQLGSIQDSVRVIRRSHQFVSTSRSSEGSVFDRSGVWRAMEYLRGSPPGYAPWITKEPNAVGIAEQSLAAAPYLEGSYLILCNGNLANYYHWVAEGLMCLDVLSRALVRDSSIKILLPKSIDLAVRFDHRDWLRAVGLANREIVEVDADFVRVGEAIWVDSDQIQVMPALHVKEFQRRIAALHAGSRGPRKKRLLVARERWTRRFPNLEQVEAAVSSFGFETVYLSGMRSVDQIRLFQSAEFIIGAHGAGLSNLLFCEPGTKVIELMPLGEFRSFFWCIAQKLELVYGLQFCANGYQDDMVVDIDKLQTLIRMVDAHAA